MPVCPPKTDKDRGRWEYVSGKAVKDLTTAVMMSEPGMTRADARGRVLAAIKDVTRQILGGKPDDIDFTSTR